MRKSDLSPAKLVVYCDASFAANWDLTSQLGFLIFLWDSFGKICLLDGASKKRDRVTRSITSELYAITLGFDRAFLLRDALFKATSIYFDIAVITNSMQIFGAITKLTQVREKRLLIDTYSLRNSYISGELSAIWPVRSERNLADPLAKVDSKNRIELRNVLNSGLLQDLHINKV
jgi:hypothetical protein